MNNIFNLLPNEILRHILLYLDVKSIKTMMEILSEFRCLDLEEILRTRRIILYPRISGNCSQHSIPSSVIELCNHTLLKCETELILKYLDDTNADLVKGDLLIFDDVNMVSISEVFLFDGDNILHMSCHRCRVIKNNVPIRYWGCSNVYFDHKLVRDQCLSNINYKLIDNTNYALFTSFIYYDREYKIIYEYAYTYEFNKTTYNKTTYEIFDIKLREEIIKDFIEILNIDDITFSSVSLLYGENIDALFIDKLPELEPCCGRLFAS